MYDANAGFLDRDFNNLVRSVIAPKPALARRVKRGFDLSFAVLLLVPLCLCALALVVLNPFFNKGTLWFTQARMGYQGARIMVVKFRTMRVATVSRDAFGQVETGRITALGRFLRRSRLDELPQIFNVLRGEMSLIGPRPDMYDHARIYTKTVSGYLARHAVLPGISGLAQTEVGYVDSVDGIRRKVAADLYYIANAGLRLDLWIFWRTLVVVFTRKGV